MRSDFSLNNNLLLTSLRDPPLLRIHSGCCCCCFSHSAYWLPTRKTTLHCGQSRSWSAEQGKEGKREGLAAHPLTPPPQFPTLLVRSKTIKNHVTIYPDATQVSVRLAPVQDSFDSSTINRPMGVASQNSVLSCAITTFPVSLPLSSPGDV